MKRLFVIFLVLITASLAFAGGGQQSGGAQPSGGSGSATAQGFGGPITVTIKVASGKITDVTAEGKSESPGIGSMAIERMPQAMVKANSVIVDGVSGASLTSQAILKAAEEAYAQAVGKKIGIAAVKMKPGIYTNNVWAYAPDKKMEVAVEVDTTKILSIQVLDNNETLRILQSAKDLLIPRIIANQSVAIDGITGATGSSGGIKQAVSLALEQALKAGGADPSAIRNFQIAPPKSTVVKTLNYDVLVIGMGGSGSAAAMAAAETQKAAGKPVSVLAIDKAGKYGGQSSVTSEVMAINPPLFMAAHNNQVSPIQVGGQFRPLPDTRKDKSQYVIKSELKKAWMDYTEGDAKEEMVDLMLNNSGPTLDWLQYQHGYFFGPPQLGVDASAIYFVVFEYNNSFMDNKHVIMSYFDQIWYDFQKLGGRYMLETEAYDLIVDGSGKVMGAKARNIDGTEYIINAKSVVTATGGFAGSGKMTAEYLSEEVYPLKGTWNHVGMHQNDGKMIQAAIDHGAGTYNIEMPPIVHVGGGRKTLHEFETTTVNVDGKDQVLALNDIPMIMAISGNVMSVDKWGRRFTIESRLAYLEPWKGGPEFYSLWSGPMVDRVRTSGFDTVTLGWFINQGGVPLHYPIPNIGEVIQKAMDYEVAWKADTLEDLARQLNIDPAKLKESVDRYNRYCAAGLDLDYHKDADFLVPIDRGPYYAFAGAPYCYSTAGGLDVNTSLEVLKKDGRTPVGGLYAAGTDCLGVLLNDKKAYVTFGGAAQGWAYTSGKLAGESAAKGAM
jgi:fumarate reductase flavoprotein subunit